MTRIFRQIAETLLKGFSVDVIEGPFDTREDAAYALDLAWESSELQRRNPIPTGCEYHLIADIRMRSIRR